MNPDIARLHAYPFEKLAALKAAVTAPTSLSPIPLSIGEPKHAPPDFVLETITTHLSAVGQYPTTRGLTSLRETIANWLQKRFSLPANSIDPEQHVLPVSGTREALFAIAQCIIDRREQPVIMMPNPFYQIYEGAALLSGAQPYYLNTTANTDFLPDFSDVPEKIWQRCQLVYICSPGNPTGRVIPKTMLAELMALSERYHFLIVSDECYSELYFDETQPPIGLLQAAAEIGNTTFKNCLVFHSLSKRSNLPGLRSGFVAGDAEVITQFYRYRTYHGCAISLPYQQASIAAWSDETHVKQNRDYYRQKFNQFIDIVGPHLPLTQPEAGFYLWPETPIDDEQFAQQLFAQQHITVLPGKYLSREAHGTNPGTNHVRLALVADVAQCQQAAERIRTFMQNS